LFDVKFPRFCSLATLPRMRSFAALLTATAAIHAAEAANVPNAGYLNFVSRPAAPPAWNFVNETTPDAAPDGSKGVIIEPDLVEGKAGRDGAVVKKIRFGPYTLKPGQKKEFPIGAFGLTPVEMGRPLPCNDCYITAMQLNLEYPDGKHANVDTGAWYGAQNYLKSAGV
jgi:hypothetical protein